MHVIQNTGIESLILRPDLAETASACTGP